MQRTHKEYRVDVLIQRKARPNADGTLARLPLDLVISALLTLLRLQEVILNLALLDTCLLHVDSEHCHLDEAVDCKPGGKWARRHLLLEAKDASNQDSN